MLNEVVMSWLKKVLQPVVLESFIRKLIKEDFSLEDNSLSVSSVNNTLGAVNALKKLKSTLDATEISDFTKIVKATIFNIDQKRFERSVTELLNMFIIRWNTKLEIWQTSRITCEGTVDCS